MNIGILTHPQGTNYGGILQCYALCTYLKKLGYDPIVLQRVSDKPFFLRKWVHKILCYLRFPRYYKPKGIDRLKNIRPFIQKHLMRTEVLDSQSKMKNVCQKYNLGAVIVGSDQVWRASYAMRFGFNYFLDFVPDNVVKLSYAASFGLSEWQYSESQTTQIKKLLSRFNGLSIREEEGIELLKMNTGYDALHLLDPTLLLNMEDYNSIISPQKVTDKYIFVYWLGDKSNISLSKEIEKIRKEGYRIIELYLRDISEQISVEDWLSYLKYADFLITDSFHGSVFSIIFQRPFVVISNDSGGNGRITSLFKLLDINNNGDKNYKKITEILETLRMHSKNFLLNSLS